MGPSSLRLRHHLSVLVSLFLLVAFCLPAIEALEVNPESPCLSMCQEPSTNTTADDIECADTGYNSTDTGIKFRDCVSCQLESTHMDPETGATDVEWGLCMCIIQGACRSIAASSWTNNYKQTTFDMPSQPVSMGFPKKRTRCLPLAKCHAKLFAPRSGTNW